MKFTTQVDLHVERLDGELLVLAPGRLEVLHLKGAEREAFELADVGTDAVPEHLETAMAALVELGVVTTDAWSRRRMIQLGGAAAAAAIAVTALPSVAAAASPATTVAPTTGNVSVRLNLMDGLTMPAESPVTLPQTGTVSAFLYGAADRTGPAIASVTVSLPAGQDHVEYLFTGVAPGNYFVDIQQPFDGLGAGGLTYLGNTYYVDWNYGHRSVPPGYPSPVAEYQPVTVTAGNTSNVTEDIQVALETTMPPWP